MATDISSQVTTADIRSQASTDGAVGTEPAEPAVGTGAGDITGTLRRLMETAADADMDDVAASALSLLELLTQMRDADAAAERRRIQMTEKKTGRGRR